MAREGGIDVLRSCALWAAQSPHLGCTQEHIGKLAPLCSPCELGTAVPGAWAGPGLLAVLCASWGAWYPGLIPILGISVLFWLRAHFTSLPVSRC